MSRAELMDEFVARVCHESNRIYCAALGEEQPGWEDAPEWQRDSALSGVRAIVEGRVTSPEQSHESWMAHKASEGWVYGATKDADLKTHPCMVPYAQLPEVQRGKDELFHGIVSVYVRALLPVRETVPMEPLPSVMPELPPSSSSTT